MSTGRNEHYRHELKYLISERERDELCRVMPYSFSLDAHAGRRENGEPGGYMIRSLYFDDPAQHAYEEKMAGIYARQKWRIRIYDCSDRAIFLERKKKLGSYILKASAPITREEFYRILAGDFGFLLQNTGHRGDELRQQFYVKCVSEMLRPCVIVDYDRIPFILNEGTVRVTFDSRLRVGTFGFDIFDPALPTIPAMKEGTAIMEIKYTEYLPKKVQMLIPPRASILEAFSKFTVCIDARRF